MVESEAAQTGSDKKTNREIERGTESKDATLEGRDRFLVPKQISKHKRRHHVQDDSSK